MLSVIMEAPALRGIANVPRVLKVKIAIQSSACQTVKMEGFAWRGLVHAKLVSLVNFARKRKLSPLVMMSSMFLFNVLHNFVAHRT